MKLIAPMAEALRLIRAGKVAEATALLQSPFPADLPAAEPPLDLKPARVSIGGKSAVSARAGAGGQFERHQHSGAAGALGYRLYIPAGAAPGMPLVVMLHGCTQSPEDFARGTGMNRLADERGFLAAYPEQTQAANAQKCWNWFKPGDQQRDAGEPALIAGLTRQVIAAHRVDPERVYVAGLSAGGAAAAIMAATYPDLFAAAGIHSGLACGSARDLPSALMAMKSGAEQGTRSRRQAGDRFVPVITFHGDKDSTVHEANARAIVAAATVAAGVPLETRTETGRTTSGRSWRRVFSLDPSGTVLIEQWTVHGAGHAWSGGSAGGSYTDPSGPDASREMLRFFLTHRRG